MSVEVNDLFRLFGSQYCSLTDEIYRLLYFSSKDKIFLEIPIKETYSLGTFFAARPTTSKYMVCLKSGNFNFMGYNLNPIGVIDILNPKTKEKILTLPKFNHKFSPDKVRGLDSILLSFKPSPPERVKDCVVDETTDHRWKMARMINYAEEEKENLDIFDFARIERIAKILDANLSFETKEGYIQPKIEIKRKESCINYIDIMDIGSRSFEGLFPYNYSYFLYKIISKKIKNKIEKEVQKVKSFLLYAKDRENPIIFKRFNEKEEGVISYAEFVKREESLSCGEKEITFKNIETLFFAETYRLKKCYSFPLLFLDFIARGFRFPGLFFRYCRVILSLSKIK